MLDFAPEAGGAASLSDGELAVGADEGGRQRLASFGQVERLGRQPPHLVARRRQQNVLGLDVAVDHAAHRVQVVQTLQHLTHNQLHLQKNCFQNLQFFFILYLCEGKSLVVVLGNDFQQVDAEHVEHHALVRAEGAGDRKVVEQLHHSVRTQQPFIIVVSTHFQQ